jgi:hypothetical protein
MVHVAKGFVILLILAIMALFSPLVADMTLYVQFWQDSSPSPEKYLTSPPSRKQKSEDHQLGTLGAQISNVEVLPMNQKGAC